MRRLQVLMALLLVGGIVVATVVLTSGSEVVVEEAEASVDCASCHSVIAKEVAESWHGQAYTDPEALALTKNFTDPACISCHAPAPIFSGNVGERVFARRERREAGVDCISCHLMPGGRVAGNRGLDAPCRPVKEPRLSAVQFCSGCHNQHWTVDEWAASPYTGATPDVEKRTCNDCHMPRVDRPLADGGPVRKATSRGS